MPRMRHTRFNVLLVEDEPGDAKLIKAAFAAGSYTCRLDHAADGVKAMEHLHAATDIATGVQLPHLMLLDLNMPRKNGHEVLREMKADNRFKNIPVVVLSTSQAESDISRAYGAGASGFVTKPMDVDALFASIRCIENFWFGVAELPL